MLPPPVVCGSQGRWANKIRCYLVFSGCGHILSISVWPGIREICIQTQGHVPRIRTAVTRAGHRDEGPEPPGEGRGQAQASPSSGPSCLVGADGKARTPSPGPRSLERGGPSQPCPSPGGLVKVGSWPGHWLHSCGDFGGAGGLTARCQRGTAGATLLLLPDKCSC